MMENKRKKGTPPPRYDDAFKAGAVRMVIPESLDSLLDEISYPRTQ